jgi:hypothetical protein
VFSAADAFDLRTAQITVIATQFALIFRIFHQPSFGTNFERHRAITNH